jgi:hypothetical protein
MSEIYMDDPRFGEFEFSLRTDSGQLDGYWTETGLFVLSANDDHIKIPYQDARPLGGWLSDAAVNEAIKLSDEEIEAIYQQRTESLQSTVLGGVAVIGDIASTIAELVDELREEGSEDSTEAAESLASISTRLRGSGDNLLDAALESMSENVVDSEEDTDAPDYTQAVKVIKGGNGGLFMRLDIIRQQSGRELELDEVQLLGGVILDAADAAETRKSIFGG